MVHPLAPRIALLLFIKSTEYLVNRVSSILVDYGCCLFVKIIGTNFKQNIEICKLKNISMLKKMSSQIPFLKLFRKCSQIHALARLCSKPVCPGPS